MTLTQVKTNSQPKVEAQLPEDRKAAVEYGLQQFNMVAAERDELRALVRQLKSDLAGYKVAMDAQAALLTDMESRVNSAYAVRDQAVAEAAKFKTTCAAVLAVLRAAETENEPLIVPAEEEQQDTHGGA